jgi:hypothetical protein
VEGGFPLNPWFSGIFFAGGRINDDGQKKRNQSGARPQLSCTIGALFEVSLVTSYYPPKTVKISAI